MHGRDTGWWVQAGRHPRLLVLPIDARAALPLFLWAVYPSWPMAGVAAASVMLFAVLAWLGYSLPTALRYLRARLRGRRLYARPWHYQKRFRARGF
jgi:hypothetical protein